MANISAEYAWQQRVGRITRPKINTEMNEFIPSVEVKESETPPPTPVKLIEEKSSSQKELDLLVLKIKNIEKNILSMSQPLHLVYYGASIYAHNRAKWEENKNLIIYPEIKDFITDFLNRTNHTFVTKNSLGERVCYIDKKRSIADIYLIVKYYYPSADLLSVIQVLTQIDKDTLQLIEEDKNLEECPNQKFFRRTFLGYFFHFCSDVQRRVFSVNNAGYLSTYPMRREMDELGLTDKELYLTLNIKNESKASFESLLKTSFP